MESFEFYNPVRILFGKEYYYELNKQIPEGNKILLLYGGGSIKKNGVYNKTLEALEGRSVMEFSGIEPNPTYEKCMEAVAFIKQNKIDFILAAGGGSVIDAAKFIGVACTYSNGDPWEILSRGKEVTSSLPFGCILTLPATGTEMNRNSVISKHCKFS